MVGVTGSIPVAPTIPNLQSGFGKGGDRCRLPSPRRVVLAFGIGDRACVQATTTSLSAAARPAACWPIACPRIAHCRVLLLEAGGRDVNPLIHVPLGLGKLHEYKMHDWGYSTEPDPGLNGRRVEEMRGKVLGGSSSINVMAYTRGDPGDYDRWAQKGALGWSFSDVLPYFKRVESWQDGEGEFRGDAGPIGVQWAKTRDPMFTAWIDSARMAGLPVTDDYNGEFGAGLRPRPILDPRRQALLGRGRLSAPGDEAEESRGRGARPCRARDDAGQARDRRRIRKKRAAAFRHGRARSDPVRRRVQLAAAADVVGHRSGRSPALGRHRSAWSTCRSAKISRTISPC